MFSEAIKNFLDSNNYSNEFYCNGVFFDMDGVLYDSMPSHASAWVKALNEVGMPFTSYEAYMNEGRTGHSTIDGVYNRTLNRDASEDEKQQIYSLKSKYFEEAEKSNPMPYAFELLQKVKAEGKKIYLVTGSGQKSLLSGLQHSFPGIFSKQRMVTAFDVTMGKPHPEPYLKALDKSGLHPWEVIVVENAPLGVASSKAAGLFTIAVNTGPLSEDILYENGADIVFGSMEELYLKWDFLEYRKNE